MIGHDSAVAVESLSRRFDDVEAVANLSFDVAPGELFGLVGPDGSGKTTTLRMLAGVLRPTSGDARLSGTSVRRHAERVKHDIAYMSQRFGLYADLTVIENLHFYADLYRVPRRARSQRLDRLFSFSNLGPFRDRLAGQLSGGMKQKLGLSCALIHQPAILLLDEPTFGIDPISRRDLWLIVHEMVASGTTALVSTSYMDEAERFDRLALLHQGRLVALDTPAALLESLTGVILDVRLPTPREALARATQHPAVTRAVLFGDRLHLTVTSADAAPAVTAHFEAAGLPVSEVRIIPPSLEDLFIERMARADRS